MAISQNLQQNRNFSREYTRSTRIFSMVSIEGLLSLASSGFSSWLDLAFALQLPVLRFPPSVLRFLCSSAFQRSWFCVWVASRCVSKVLLFSAPSRLRGGLF